MYANQDCNVASAIRSATRRQASFRDTRVGLHASDTRLQRVCYTDTRNATNGRGTTREIQERLARLDNHGVSAYAFQVACRSSLQSVAMQVNQNSLVDLAGRIGHKHGAYCRVHAPASEFIAKCVTECTGNRQSACIDRPNTLPRQQPVPSA